MALLRKINTRAKTENNTGFGVNSSDYGGRFVNKDGIPNIEKRGLGVWQHNSWYHTLLSMPRWKFLLLLFSFYIVTNFVFAVLYYIIGVEHLDGIKRGSAWLEFEETFFFSAQTLTTVGYGRISPADYISGTIAAMEALTGLLSFAIATGLFYGRFSKPKAYLKFSKHAVIAPYKDITALMLRTAPFKNTNLTDAEAKLTLAIMNTEDDGRITNKFYPLELEFEKINSLTLSWTIVHPITENSPLYNFTKEDFDNTNGEILVFLKAFDDMFSNTVLTRSSYTFREVVVGAKFVPMYHRSNNGSTTILNLDKLDTFTEAELHVAAKVVNA
jgi:inward rectifier potassium channel